MFRHRRREIVAARFGKGEKRGGGYDADGMAAKVVHPGVAAAIPVKARHRAHRTGLERFAEHIAGRAAPALSAAPIVSQHLMPLSRFSRLVKVGVGEPIDQARWAGGRRSP